MKWFYLWIAVDVRFEPKKEVHKIVWNNFEHREAMAPRAEHMDVRSKSSHADQLFIPKLPGNASLQWLYESRFEISLTV